AGSLPVGQGSEGPATVVRPWHRTSQTVLAQVDRDTAHVVVRIILEGLGHERFGSLLRVRLGGQRAQNIRFGYDPGESVAGEQEPVAARGVDYRNVQARAHLLGAQVL